MYLLSHESLCLSFGQSVYLSTHQSVFLFVCLCRRLSISNSDLICYLFTSPLTICLSGYLFVCIHFSSLTAHARFSVDKTYLCQIWPDCRRWVLGHWKPIFGAPSHRHACLTWCRSKSPECLQKRGKEGKGEDSDRQSKKEKGNEERMEINSQKV